MPRFFFNVYDGKTYIDEEGVAVPDHAFSRREAIRHSAALLEEAAVMDDLGPDWRMEVIDGQGQVLFTLTFFVKPLPAASQDVS